MSAEPSSRYSSRYRRTRLLISRPPITSGASRDMTTTCRRPQCHEKMAAEIIRRGEELASIEAFLDRAQEGPGALVLSGRGGHRQDDPVAGRSEGGGTSLRARPPSPKRGSRGLAFLHRAFRSARPGLRRGSAPADTIAATRAGGRPSPRRAGREGSGSTRDRARAARRPSSSRRARPDGRRAR